MLFYFSLYSVTRAVKVLTNQYSNKYIIKVCTELKVREDSVIDVLLLTFRYFSTNVRYLSTHLHTWSMTDATSYYGRCFSILEKVKALFMTVRMVSFKDTKGNETKEIRGNKAVPRYVLHFESIVICMLANG